MVLCGPQPHRLAIFPTSKVIKTGHPEKAPRERGHFFQETWGKGKELGWPSWPFFLREEIALQGTEVTSSPGPARTPWKLSILSRATTPEQLTTTKPCGPSLLPPWRPGPFKVPKVLLTGSLLELFYLRVTGEGTAYQSKNRC